VQCVLIRRESRFEKLRRGSCRCEEVEEVAMKPTRSFPSKTCMLKFARSSSHLVIPLSCNAAHVLRLQRLSFAAYCQTFDNVNSIPHEDCPDACSDRLLSRPETTASTLMTTSSTSLGHHIVLPGIKHSERSSVPIEYYSLSTLPIGPTLEIAATLA